MESIIRRRAAAYVCRSCTRQSQRKLLQQQQQQQRQQRTYSSAAPRPDIYDVVCVGGGPAGLSLLAALRSNPVTSHLRIALVEAQDLSKTKSWALPPTQFSNRCSSLTPSSALFLDKMGAWAHLDRARVQPYHEMQVWDGVTDARIEFDWARDAITPAGARIGTHQQIIAYMTENLNLTSGLLKRLDQLGGVAVFDSAKVEHISFGAESETEDGPDLREWPVVHLAGGAQLSARLLVGADGANSPVRAFAGIEARGWDYGRHGVVATLELEGHADSWENQTKVAYQRFLPTGPVAMLPMPGNHATLVWSTTPENAALLKSLSPTDFIAMVNAAFRLSVTDLAFMHSPACTSQADEYAWRLGHTSSPSNHKALPQPATAVQPGTVASFPLKMRHADTYIGERVALVGDAAHTIHPLAGQGLNQGQGDVQSLVRTIEFAVGHGQDLGVRMSLEPYLAERYAANHVLLGVCDKIHKLYSVENGPLVGVRSLGLSAVNGLGGLKRFIMGRAAGGVGV
ncbi:hypothetical protein B0T17DRAFT_492802 [Bombardia bombarda]|uniref:Ubiquinone biosynthesis monooxygenase COQ6, mitochondrial n=1 Tax=Bombardia bombarda TaxID=252184 RepID=A0AA39X0F3_9PEZI|nr:hypothetical protein B0T17DRAFT_492802 [Bombardia bombarda]